MELKFIDIIGFRTEDPKYPTTNLLREGKWLCEKNTRSSVNDVTLQLDKVYVISAIDIGNCGSAFVSVEVSRMGLNRYETLLPSTEFMTARDGQTKKNWSCVQMFSEEHFTPGVRQQKWDLVRVVCMQPFLHQEQFGLSFVKVFSASVESPRPSQPQSAPPLWSLSVKLRNRSLDKVLPVPANRSKLLLQAVEKQQGSLALNNSPDRKTASGNSHFHDMPHDSVVQGPTLHSDQKTEHRQTVTMRYQQQNANRRINYSTTVKASIRSAAGTQDSVSSPSLRNAVSLARVHCSKNPSKAQSFEQIAVLSSRNVHEAASVSTLHMLKRETRQTSTKGGALSKKRCMRDIGRIAQMTGSGEQREGDYGYVVDLDSDSAVEVLSHDDVSTVVIPPAPGCKKGVASASGDSVQLSPQVQRDFESEEEIVIVPLSMPKGTCYQGSAVRRLVSLSDEVLSSSKHALQWSPESRQQTMQTLCLDSEGEWEPEAVPGPSRIPCPLCSELFDISSIEQHASTCDVERPPEITACPICMMYFPPTDLIQHADLCAERSLKLGETEAAAPL